MGAQSDLVAVFHRDSLHSKNVMSTLAPNTISVKTTSDDTSPRLPVVLESLASCGESAVVPAVSTPARVSSPEDSLMSRRSNSIASTSSDADAVYAQLVVRTSTARAKKRAATLEHVKVVAHCSKPKKARTLSKDRRWTCSEDNLLRKAVMFDSVKDWTAISSDYFEGERTWYHCRKRWETVLSVGLVKGKWSQQEDTMILQSLLNGVTSWKQIASNITGRVAKQCRERWQNHLDPLLKNKGWLPEEDNLLKEAQAQWGNKWKVISMLFVGRSETSVKNRWNSARFRPSRQRGVETKFLKFHLPLAQRIQTNSIEHTLITQARQVANDIEIKGVDYVLTEGHSDYIYMSDETRLALTTDLNSRQQKPPSPSCQCFRPEKTCTSVLQGDSLPSHDTHATTQDTTQTPPAAKPPPHNPNLDVLMKAIKMC